MSKPKLDVAAMADELGAVASFALNRRDDRSPGPLATSSPEPQPETPEEPEGGESPPPPFSETRSVLEGNATEPAVANTATGVSPDERRPARPPVRRTIARYAFEFYQDQIESLRRFSLEEKAMGEKGSMSEMVREAIDAYLVKRIRAWYPETETTGSAPARTPGDRVVTAEAICRS